MKGRIENEIKIFNKCEEILKTLPDYIYDYYLNIKSSREANSCLDYIRIINRFYNFIGNKDLKDITNLDISRYFDSIRYIIKNGELKESSYSYKKTTWSALNNMFMYFVDVEMINKNPMKTIPRSSGKDNVKRKSLDIKELNMMLNQVNEGAGNRRAKSKQFFWKERDMLILYLFMNTGMRKTALTEINIEDVDFEKRIITVIDKRHKIHEYIITDELEYLLKQWLVKRNYCLGNCQCDALFISNRKVRMHVNSVDNIVQKYSKEALGESISPHKLRASFVTIYYEASGHDIKATAEAVGHANPSTTAECYIVQKNNKREEAAKFMSSNLKLY